MTEPYAFERESDVTPAPQPRVADILARRLRAAGVRFSFGIPGGEVLTLLDAFGRAGISFVAARHENAAGFMAEGVHRVDGSPGVLVATIGPGVTNTVNVCANALQDQVPLIILGGHASRSSQPAYTHQVIDQLSVFRPVTKAVFEVRPEHASALITAAIKIAFEEPRGPVYLDCPFDVADTAESTAVTSDQGLDVSPWRRPPPRSDAVDDACRAFEVSEKPLVIAGLRALRPGVSDALRQLVRKHQVPVVTTYKAKGIVPESDSNCLGAAGLSPLADASLIPLVQASDLILLVGYDPIEMRSAWVAPFSSDTSLIDIDLVPIASPAWKPTVGLYGDIVPILDRLSQVDRRPKAIWPGQEPASSREALQRSFAPQASWEPSVLFEAAQSFVDGETFVTVDTGAHRILWAHTWKCDVPAQVFQSSGFCTMACALPLAIGAKMAAPERQVIAILGDGGLEMGLGELATLRDSGHGLVVIVLDDSAYALIDMKQRKRGFPSSGVHLGRTEFAKVAEAMGGFGVRVDDRPSLESALEAARERDGFTLVHACFPKGVYDGRI